jgi:hypothetical protein
VTGVVAGVVYGFAVVVSAGAACAAFVGACSTDVDTASRASGSDGAAASFSSFAGSLKSVSSLPYRSVHGACQDITASYDI